ncbi:hypothetical protein N9812_03765, partial [bacterium]|nr:hypothetical protein [bacterium]
MVLRRFRRKRDAEARRYAYSRWDGSQAGFDLNAFDLFAELSDELIHHGDPNSALRNLLQQGFDDDKCKRKELYEFRTHARTLRREFFVASDVGVDNKPDGMVAQEIVIGKHFLPARCTE